MRKMKHRFFLLFLVFSLCLAGESTAEEEYNLKAAMLVKFPIYFDWPAEADVNDAAKPFVIALIGANPFGSYLVETCAMTKIKNKEIKIFFISRVNEIAAVGCNLLFIADTDDKKLAEILAYTRNKPILTVGDGKNFAEKGVQINFVIVDRNVRFVINPRAATESRLVMNYHLLGLAVKVIGR
jgi:hypothetical protein